MFSGGIVAEAHFFTQQLMVVYHHALPKGQDSGLMLQHAMQTIQQYYIGITVSRIYTARFDALGALAQSCLSTSDCSRACLLQGAVCRPFTIKDGSTKIKQGTADIITACLARGVVPEGWSHYHVYSPHYYLVFPHRT